MCIKSWIHMIWGLRFCASLACSLHCLPFNFGCTKLREDSCWGRLSDKFQFVSQFGAQFFRTQKQAVLPPGIFGPWFTRLVSHIQFLQSAMPARNLPPEIPILCSFSDRKSLHRGPRPKKTKSSEPWRCKYRNDDEINLINCHLWP